MSMPDEISERDLHAFVDGALDAEARARVEAWLSAHPEDAAMVAAYEAQNRGLHTAFDPVLGEAVPDRLLAATQPGSLFAADNLRRLAAALVLLAIGAGAGWFVRDYTTERLRLHHSLADESLSAHRVFVVEVKHPVEVAADQEQHLVTWLTKRIGAEVRAPNLRAVGYQLIGGRLLHAENEPAAQLMYESQHGDRITIYVRANPSHELTAFRFDQAGDLAAFYWLEKDLAYAIVAKLPRDQLYAIAETVYAQLEKDG